MECQGCSRHQDAVSGFNCPACARVCLHHLRLQHVETLLEKERLSRQVEEAVVKQDIAPSHALKDGTGQSGIGPDVKSSSQTSDLAELLGSRERIDTIVKRTATLHEELRALKKEVEDRRTQSYKRRKDLQQARETLKSQQHSTLPLLKRSNKSRSHADERIYAEVVTMRVQQCKRAASLAGLKQIIKQIEGGKKAPHHYLNQLHILDIRQVNNAEPTNINAMFQSIARLLLQASSYLHVRLPAEVILPYYGHVWPSIYAPSSSYTNHAATPLKKFSPLVSRENSIKNSLDLEQRVAGRPRHLSTDKKLPRLFKENTVAYALLVEGIALLAWDVAWLCRTQGLPVAEKNWDDVCDIGRNLWLLFCAQSPSTSHADLRRGVRADPAAAIKQARTGIPFGAPVGPTALGVFSHASAKNNLESPRLANAGTYDVTPRGWKFANPVMIYDELRGSLLTEMSGHDWEMLDDGESEAGDNTEGMRRSLWETEEVMVMLRAVTEMESSREGGQGVDGPSLRADSHLNNSFEFH